MLLIRYWAVTTTKTLTRVISIQDKLKFIPLYSIFLMVTMCDFFKIEIDHVLIHLLLIDSNAVHASPGQFRLDHTKFDPTCKIGTDFNSQYSGLNFLKKCYRYCTTYRTIMTFSLVFYQ